MPPSLPRTVPAWLISIVGALSCAAPLPTAEVASDADVVLPNSGVHDASPEPTPTVDPPAGGQGSDGDGSVTRAGTVLRVIGVEGPPDREPTFRLALETPDTEPVTFDVFELDLTGLSPNGRFYAARWDQCPGVTETQRNTAAMCIYDIENRSTWVFDEPTETIVSVGPPVWSPDGRFLAWFEDGEVETRLRIADPARRVLRETASAAHIEGHGAATSPRWEDTATLVVAESTDAAGPDAWVSWFGQDRRGWHLVRYDTALTRLDALTDVEARSF